MADRKGSSDLSCSCNPGTQWHWPPWSGQQQTCGWPLTVGAKQNRRLGMTGLFWHLNPHMVCISKPYQCWLFSSSTPVQGCWEARLLWQTEEVKNGMPTLNLDEPGLKKKNHLSDTIKINRNKNILFQKPNNQNGLQFTLIAPDHRSNKETLSNCITISSKKWRGLLSRLILLRNPSRGVRWNSGTWSISFFAGWTTFSKGPWGRKKWKDSL